MLLDNLEAPPENAHNALVQLNVVSCNAFKISNVWLTCAFVFLDVLRDQGPGTFGDTTDGPAGVCLRWNKMESNIEVKIDIHTTHIQFRAVIYNLF